jgi:hypothetical protein
MEAAEDQRNRADACLGQRGNSEVDGQQKEAVVNMIGEKGNKSSVLVETVGDVLDVKDTNLEINNNGVNKEDFSWRVKKLD